MKVNAPPAGGSRLRRDLGTLESYAALIGILIGAGIFKVTSQAWALTGPSVILGYLVLVPAIATSIPYAAFLSTPLGREPGGSICTYRAPGGFRIAYIGAWLKDHFVCGRRRLPRGRLRGILCRNHSAAA